MTTTTHSTAIPVMTQEQIHFAKTLYEEKLRFEVETEENIGKMLFIDVQSGEYTIGNGNGLAEARKLQGERYGNGMLYGIRIGYKTAETIGGIRERIQR